jgi:hypothetical protein
MEHRVADMELHALLLFALQEQKTPLCKSLAAHEIRFSTPLVLLYSGMPVLSNAAACEFAIRSQTGRMEGVLFRMARISGIGV